MDIRTLIPKDKFDLRNISRIRKLDFLTLEPIIPELLEWIQDINWPVARYLAPFLATVGLPLKPYLKPIFESNDAEWIYFVLNNIVEKSPELLLSLRSELEELKEAYCKTLDESDVCLTATELLDNYFN